LVLLVDLREEFIAAALFAERREMVIRFGARPTP
jgi:hypothetical protein